MGLEDLLCHPPEKNATVILDQLTPPVHYFPMTTDSRYRLAPLQRLMLQDSLADDGHGRHVEQVEIVFSQEIARERIISAWRETVAGTEALRVAFVGEALEVVFMEPADFLRIERAVPDAWQDWLDADRVRPLLVPDEVPWRAAFWPLAGA